MLLLLMEAIISILCFQFNEHVELHCAVCLRKILKCIVLCVPSYKYYANCMISVKIIITQRKYIEVTMYVK